MKKPKRGGRGQVTDLNQSAVNSSTCLCPFVPIVSCMAFMPFVLIVLFVPFVSIFVPFVSFVSRCVLFVPIVPFVLAHKYAAINFNLSRCPPFAPFRVSSRASSERFLAFFLKRLIHF